MTLAFTFPGRLSIDPAEISDSNIFLYFSTRSLLDLHFAREEQPVRRYFAKTLAISVAVDISKCQDILTQEV